jgi:cytochrome c5
MNKVIIASAALLLGMSGSVLASEPPAKYNMFCVACHSTGAAGAPKAGDKAAWEPRLAAGMEALLATTKSGKGAMPSMGLCGNCSDEEFKAIIEFMSK